MRKRHPRVVRINNPMHPWADAVITYKLWGLADYFDFYPVTWYK